MKEFTISKSLTPRDTKSLVKYFAEIDKIDLIDETEEVALAKKIKQGDQKAIQRLTSANLRFVVSVAKSYQNLGLPLGDLIAEGNIGLITAVKRYDESKGFKFISYAVWWIRQAIVQAISAHARFVRLPYNQLNLRRKIRCAIETLEHIHFRRPSTEELAVYLGISVEKVAGLYENTACKVMSLDSTFSAEDDKTLVEVLDNGEPPADHLLIAEACSEELKSSLKFLCNRDRELLTLYFGLGIGSPMTLEEIGKKFNVNATYVCRLKDDAVKRLRNCPAVRSLLCCH